jgi:hypothetical protein
MLESVWGRPRAWLPDEVVTEAARDTDPAFRAWVARRARHLPEDTRRALADDPDELVRASLFENPNAMNRDAVLDPAALFKTLSPMARLAFVRNPSIDLDLVATLFDPTSDLNLSDSDRTHLILASLTNPRLSKARASIRGMEEAKLYVDARYVERDIEKLWANMRAWTGEWAKLKRFAYAALPCPDAGRAAEYASTDDHSDHWELLDGAGPDDRRTLELALADSEYSCRQQAEGIAGPQPKPLEAITEPSLARTSSAFGCALIMALGAALGALSRWMFGAEIPIWAFALAGGVAYVAGSIGSAQTRQDRDVRRMSDAIERLRKKVETTPKVTA